MRKNKTKPSFPLFVINRSSETKQKTVEQKQELILFVESKLKRNKKNKQTRNDSCYCPPHTKKEPIAIS